MDITTIISLVVIAINIGIAIINFILTKVKKKAVSEENEELKSKVESAEGALELVEDIIPAAVVFAENNATSGTLKELIAKSQVLLQCSSKGISYNEQEVVKTISEIIDLTKKVNYDKKEENTEG